MKCCSTILLAAFSLAAITEQSSTLLATASETPSLSPLSVLNAVDFGLLADGVTDDGPAIARLLEAAMQSQQATCIQFPSEKTIYVKSAPSRYVFPLKKASKITIDGGGSTFLLDPHLRFMHLQESEDITLRRFNVDFRPLPFVDGEVIGKDASKRFLTVRIAPSEQSRLVGAPTGEDGEQAFFAMLWREGPYGPLSKHYWVERIEAGATPDTVAVYATTDFHSFDAVNPGQWKISLPVAGIAHRYGPGPCFYLHDNTTLHCHDIEVWSAPWFGFTILRNEGDLLFQRVNIRPKPESGRLMSLWRDGFHVKGNRATLLWEDCTVAAMNDDAFNISTHSSRIKAITTPKQIQVRQKFPLGYIPWRVGDTLVAADEANKRLLGQSRILKADNAAPPKAILELESPIAGLAEGVMVWQAESANPKTTLRNCRIENSCRMQSSVSLENCHVTGLLWFYAEHIEGPFPSHVSVKNCLLQRGRGNPDFALIVGGDAPQAQPPRAIHDIHLERNQIYGGLRLQGAEDVRLLNNRFLEKEAPIQIQDNYFEKTLEF